MFNKSEILTRAWELVRQANVAKFGLRHVLSNAMRTAWGEAKYAVAAAKRAALAALPRTEADRVREAISMLDNKDTWSDADYAKSDKLHADLRVTVEHEAAASQYEKKRALIAAAAGRFCSVTFIKKDGSERVMRIQPAALRSHIKGETASQAAHRAVQTCARRHPHLLPVWDTEAASARSVNLATISRIAIDGAVHHFAR